MHNPFEEHPSRHYEAKRFVYLDGGIDHQAEGVKIYLSTTGISSLRDILIEFITHTDDRNLAIQATDFLISVRQAQDPSNCPDFYSKWDNPKRFFVKPSELTREDD